MRVRRFVAAASLCALSAATACGAAQPVPGAAAQGGRRLVGSRHHTYSDVAELRRDATDVVVARATDRVIVDTISGVPFTVTEMEVAERMRGVGVGLGVEPLLLRQLGSTDVPAEGGPLVEAGRTYLLFVRPFEMVEGVPTGQHVAVGAQAGIFAGVGVDDFVRTDPESIDLPEHIARRDAV